MLKNYLKLNKTRLFILCISFITVSFNINAQEVQILKNKRDTIIAAALEISQLTKYCALTSIDSAGIPQTRTMNPYPLKEDMIVMFGTHRDSHKVKEIKENPNVNVYYAVHTEAKGYVAITGKAEIIDDKEFLIANKRDYWEMYIPDWEDIMVIIKITPEKLSIINYKYGLNNNGIAWRAPSIEF